MSLHAIGGVFRTAALGVIVTTASATSPSAAGVPSASMGRATIPETNGTHELAYIGEWGTGRYEDIYVEGNYAFCAAFRAGLDVVDISDPGDPEIIANRPTEYDALGVHVSASHAFLVTYRENVGSRLEVFDVSDPLSPSLVGTFEPPSGYAYPRVLFVDGDHAYLGYSSGGPVADLGIDILDVSEPTSPAFVSAFRGVSNVRDIFVVDELAYLASSSNGLWIVDVADPGSPSPVGVLDPSPPAMGVFVVDNYAYLAAYDSGLVVVDVTDPSSPFETGRADWGGWSGEVFVSGSYAFMDGTGALNILDVSNPSVPVRVGAYSPGVISNLEIFVVGTTAYFADRYGARFQIIDASDPTSPVRLGGWQMSELAYDVAVSGGYAYLATGHGLAVLDLADPSQPNLAAFYPGYEGAGSERALKERGETAKPVHGASPEFIFPEEARAVEVEGSLAYLDSSSPQGIHILEVSDPSNPELQEIYETGIQTNDLFLQGDYLYVTHGATGGSMDGLLILDVSNPLLPWLAGSFGPGLTGGDVDVQGEHASVALEQLRILDVDPPWDVTEVSAPGGHGRHFRDGSHIYQCNRSGTPEFRILDVSNPADPQVVGGFPLDCTEHSPVSVTDRYAYVYAEWLDPRHALFVFDVSDPTTPVPVGTYPQRGWGREVTTESDYVYLADGETGKLLIYRVVSSDLSVIKTDSLDPIPPGADLSYTLTVSNSGWSDATDVVLTDTLPPDVTFISATPGAPTCTESSGVVTCALGTLANGMATQVTIDVEVSVDATGTLSNAASVLGTQIDWNMANNVTLEDTVIGPPECDLAVDKVDLLDVVLPGDHLTYQITAGNFGPSNAAGVLLTDTLPAEVTFVEAVPGAPTCVEVGGVVTCDLDFMGPDATSLVEIEVEVDAGFSGILINTVDLTGNDFDPDPSNNDDIETTRVDPGLLMADDFESGDTSAWSNSVP